MKYSKRRKADTMSATGYKANMEDFFASIDIALQNARYFAKKAKNTKRPQNQERRTAPGSFNTTINETATTGASQGQPTILATGYQATTKKQALFQQIALFAIMSLTNITGTALNYQKRIPNT